MHTLQRLPKNSYNDCYGYLIIDMMSGPYTFLKNAEKNREVSVFTYADEIYQFLVEAYKSRLGRFCFPRLLDYSCVFTTDSDINTNARDKE